MDPDDSEFDAALEELIAEGLVTELVDDETGETLYMLTEFAEAAVKH